MRHTQTERNVSAATSFRFGEPYPRGPRPPAPVLPAAERRRSVIIIFGWAPSANGIDVGEIGGINKKSRRSSRETGGGNRNPRGQPVAPAQVSRSTKKLSAALAGESPGFRVILRPGLPIPNGTVASSDLRHRSQWRVRDGFSPSSSGAPGRATRERFVKQRRGLYQNPNAIARTNRASRHIRRILLWLKELCRRKTADPARGTAVSSTFGGPESESPHPVRGREKKAPGGIALKGFRKEGPRCIRRHARQNWFSLTVMPGCLIVRRSHRARLFSSSTPPRPSCLPPRRGVCRRTHEACRGPSRRPCLRMWSTTR